MNFQEIKELIFNYRNSKYTKNLELIHKLNDVNIYEKILKNITGDERIFMDRYFYQCNMYQKYHMNTIQTFKEIKSKMKSDELENLKKFKETFNLHGEVDYHERFLTGIYNNTVFDINTFMKLEFNQIYHHPLYDLNKSRCICSVEIKHIHHIASFNPYLNNGIVILRVGSCCIKRFFGNFSKICVKCHKSLNTDFKYVDKKGKIFMCNDCFDISDKCKLCNKNTKYGHNIIECKNKYNAELRPNSKKEKVCTYGDCNNFCKKYDFCKDHIPLSECKHCNVMYKPESLEPEFINKCNDCFKCIKCKEFKKENNKKSFDVYCTQCNVEYDNKKIEEERLQKILDIEYDKQQKEKARLQKIKDDYDEEHKIYNCRICNIIIDKNQSKYGNKCYNCNNNKRGGSPDARSGSTPPIEKSNTCRQCGKFISDHQTKFGNKCYDCNNIKK